MDKGQAERLMLLLEETLSENGLGWGDLTAIGVGIGPGNFTGIRISVAAARGLALALRIPAIGVSTFEAQAHGHPRPLASIVDARRGQTYLQVLEPSGPAIAQLLPRDAAEAKIAAKGLVPVGGVPDPQSVAAGIAHIAAQRRSLNPGRPAPFYIRSVDAAPPRDPAPAILDDTP